jgi:hypothetical protein
MLTACLVLTARFYTMANALLLVPLEPMDLLPALPALQNAKPVIKMDALHANPVS